MKKWIAFASVMALTLIIAACGANSSGGNNSGNNAGAAVNTGAEPTSEVVLTASSWEFDQQEYQIKAGEPVALTLKSVDGVHGVQILKTAYKIGNNKTVTVQFDEPGTYEIICNIQCGVGHGKMKATLVVT
ncbi:cupredoxin domain-containing protein [Paenibacillus sp. LHD-117]|uniref:cupredoxin domain-containing protein n=1 Tax=Paenibacillus sp. LHD-117 TaxID=3071412 RepID=UPI0027E1CC60|nr:cupredoxin domain-containing protein [Paenibacillus sp. LHD-117]MDQ6423011.1 cupredoxin domain-containing protein [Paenibacillus sp. LHD-117]